MRFKAIIAIASTVAMTAVLAFMSSAAADQPDHGPESFDNYVALGDSYTAGPLIPVETPGALGCVRSTANYPAFLASYFHVKTFTDVSCSGARSYHLYEPQTAMLPDGAPENRNAPQLLAVNKKTDLVTLGMGGNDFSLFGDLIDHCADEAKAHPDADTPCKDYFTEDGVDTKMRDAKKIQKNIEKNVKSISEKAPHAKIVVVGYIDILPAHGTCEDVPFAAGDYAWGIAIEKRLNRSIKNAATKYGATYIDMHKPSKGHDACSADPWVNGSQLKPLEAADYHPFKIGMKNIAQTTYHTLTGQIAPETIPDVQVIKRLPSLIDVRALAAWLASSAGKGGLPKDTPAITGLQDLQPSPSPNPSPSPQSPADSPKTTQDSAAMSPAANHEPNGGHDDSDNQAAGVLPDTGGTSSLLLVAGVCALLSGARVLSFARLKR